MTHPYDDLELVVIDDDDEPEFIIEDIKSFFSDEEELALTAAAPDSYDGAMIALVPSDEDAKRIIVESGLSLDDLHLTLCYLGETSKITPDVRDALLNAVSLVSENVPVVDADAFAISLFNPTNTDRDTCIVLLVSGDELVPVQREISNLAEKYLVERYPEQHEPWIPHVTLTYTDDSRQVSSLKARTGPIKFDRLRVSFAGESHDFSLFSDAMTAHGTHNQKDHGNWSDGELNLPDMKVFSKSSAGKDAWLMSGDVSVRASTLWAETMGGMKAIQRSIKNIRSGDDPLNDVDLNDPFFKKIYERKRGKQTYTQDDMAGDIVRSARRLIEQQDAATPSGELYRGMRIESKDAIQVGQRIDGGATAWTPNLNTGTRYANDTTGPQGEYRARHDWTPVLIRGSGLHGVDVGSQVTGSLANQQPEVVVKDDFVVNSVETYDTKVHGDLFISYDRTNPPLIVTVRPVT